jgi:nucleotide-binding universal stress UspA family protein
MPVIKLILCPVDFSDTAALGAREAASLARSAGAELLLVHALPEPWLSGHDERGYRAPIAQQYELIALRKLNDIASALSSMAPTRSVLVHGAVDDGIAQAAIKHGADLIVMGTRARKGLSRLLTDSTTERVMRRARVPVVRVCPAARPTTGYKATLSSTAS